MSARADASASFAAELARPCACCAAILACRASCQLTMAPTTTAAVGTKAMVRTSGGSIIFFSRFFDAAFDQQFFEMVDPIECAIESDITFGDRVAQRLALPIYFFFLGDQ